VNKIREKKSNADQNICCQDDRPICRACQESVSVDQYLKKNKAHTNKITMLVINDVNHQKKYATNTKSLKNYAKLNNYLFVEKITGQDPRCDHVKKFFFNKHCIVYYYMVDRKNNDEWIFVFDGDNAVRNPNTRIRLESFLKDDKDIMYYYRFHNNEIAAGNYAIKNTKWAKNYLKGYYELHKTYTGYNEDNGALHYYLLPDKKKCHEFSSSKTLDTYFKFVECVHRELKVANFPLKAHIFIYKHGKAWTYDGWVVDYKWSNNTLMQHAMKRPPMKGYSYENNHVDEKELKNILDEKFKKVQEKRPYVGWEYTKTAWNVRKNVIVIPMIYDHLKLFNDGLRKQLNGVVSVIYISGVGDRECPSIDNHYVQCDKEYQFKAVGLNILFKYVANKYPKNTLVTIMDADDTFSPCTLKQIDMFYAKHNPKILFHSLSRTDNHDQKCKEPQVTYDGLYLYDLAERLKRLHLLDEATHGHITTHISVALEIPHESIPKAGEDCLFMRAVIKKYGRKKDTIMFTKDIHTIYKKPGNAVVKTTKYRRKIMIGIPMRNRVGYVKFHAKILTQYNKVDSKDIFIFDDYSDQYGEKDLRNWYGKNIHYFRTKKAVGADANTRSLFEMFAKSEYDILLTLDSDLLMKNNWKKFIYDNIDKSGVISLYHSNADHHKTTDCDGEKCRKHSMGNAAAVMTKDVVQKMLKQHKNHYFDWGWVEYFTKHGIHMYVPQNSIVMHYGKVGQNNDCNNVLEVAKDFDRSVLPVWIKSGLEFYFDKCSDPSTPVDFSPIDENRNINKNTNALEQLIMTSVYTFKNDPQRGKPIKCNFDYIANFYNSVVFHKLNALIIHDCFSESFVEKLSTSTIEFLRVKVPSTGMSTNDYRFLKYREQLKRAKYYLFVDASDVFFNSNPFAYMKNNRHKLFISPDIGTFHKNAWNVKACYGTAGELWDQKLKLYNAGVWGGESNAVDCILNCVKEQLTTVVQGRGNCNMPVLNWCVHFGKCETIDNSLKFVNPFRHKCKENFPIIHNKCRETEGKTCLVRENKKLVLTKKSSECKQLTGHKEQNECKRVFIDMGANIGMHARFIFEPELYPPDKKKYGYKELKGMYEYFNKYLGDPQFRKKKGNVCVFGFEANPVHAKRLNSLNDAYNAKGWIVNYNVPLAVWKNTDGVDLHVYNVHKTALGSSITNRNDRNPRETVHVPSVNISKFVKYIKAKYNPDIIMGKLDIEGAEYEVLPSLEKNGLLCAEQGFHIITYEFHTYFKGANKNWVLPRTFSPCTETLMIDLDSEAYNEDGKPLPSSKKKHEHIVYVGDSLTRYRYLDLVFQEHFEGRETPAKLINEKMHKSWKDFYEYSTTIFEKSMKCDCYRSQSWDVPSICENRFYKKPNKNKWLTYIQWFGKHRNHGHTTPIFNKNVTFDWEYDIFETVEKIILKLKPKPTHIVFNNGYWQWKFDVKRLFKIVEASGVVPLWAQTSNSQHKVPNLTPNDEKAKNIFGNNYIPFSIKTIVNDFKNMDNRHFSNPLIYTQWNKDIMKKINTIN
jgi:FkbM family methyltransferase